MNQPLPTSSLSQKNCWLTALDPPRLAGYFYPGQSRLPAKPRSRFSYLVQSTYRGYNLHHSADGKIIIGLFSPRLDVSVRIAATLVIEKLAPSNKLRRDRTD